MGKSHHLLLHALRLDEDLAKGLIPKKTANTVDQVSFEEIVQSAVKCSSDDFSEFAFNKTKPEDDAQLGPFTKCVLQSYPQKSPLKYHLTLLCIITLEV